MPSEQAFSRCFTHQRGVIVSLVWEVSIVALVLYFLEEAATSAGTYFRYFEILAAGLAFFLFPLFGWLGDSIIGRYRAVKLSLFIIWVCTILFTVSGILESYLVLKHGSYAAIRCVLASGAVIVAACFMVNNFHLGIDQLEDSPPSWKISSYISKYVSCMYFGMGLKTIAFRCINPLVSAGLASMIITLAVSLSVLCTKEMTIVPTYPNSLALIFNVLKYTVQNKYPRLQSAYSYWRHEKHRINLAKKAYGGPFTSEEVEDVKIFLKLLVVVPVSCFLPELFLSLEIMGKQIFIYHYSDTGYVKPNQGGTYSYQQCLLRECIYNISSVYITVGIIVYENIVYPLLRKYIASVTISKKLLAGMVFSFFTWLSYAVLEIDGHVVHFNKSRNITCLFRSNEGTFLNGESMSLSFYWLCVPKILKATAQYLLLSSGLELLCAQSPYSMKNLLVGWAWSMFMVALSGNKVLQWIFGSIKDGEHFSCGLAYFIFATISTGVAVAFAAMVFTWYYKRRRRENRVGEEIIGDGFDR